MKKLLLENVLTRLNEAYPQYDYSFINEYQNSTSKITIRCPKHGEFSSELNSLLRGKVKIPCPICRRESGNLMGIYYSDTLDFIQEYYRRHPNSVYDLSKVIYTTSHQDVVVVCKKHNVEFSCKAYKLMS